MTFVETDIRPFPKNDPHEVGFFAAVLGLIFEPQQVIGLLLDRPVPRYAFAMFFLVVASLATPILSWANHRGLYEVASPFLLALLVLVGMSLTLFMLAEFMLLALFRVRCSFVHVLALTSYLGVPLALAALLSCFFDYLFSGSLTIQEQLLTTYSIAHIASVRAMLLLGLASVFWDLLILHFGLRTLGHLDSSVAFLLALMSQGLFALSLAFSIACAEMVDAGFLERVMSLVSSKVIPW